MHFHRNFFLGKMYTFSDTVFSALFFCQPVGKILVKLCGTKSFFPMLNYNTTESWNDKENKRHENCWVKPDTDQVFHLFLVGNLHQSPIYPPNGKFFSLPGI